MRLDFSDSDGLEPFDFQSNIYVLGPDKSKRIVCRARARRSHVELDGLRALAVLRAQRRAERDLATGRELIFIPPSRFALYGESRVKRIGFVKLPPPRG